LPIFETAVCKINVSYWSFFIWDFYFSLTVPKIPRFPPFKSFVGLFCISLTYSDIYSRGSKTNLFASWLNIKLPIVKSAIMKSVLVIFITLSILLEIVVS
jgi:hypothetical protein